MNLPAAISGAQPSLALGAARAAQAARLRAALAAESARAQYQWHGVAPRYVNTSWWQRTWIGRALLALRHWLGRLMQALSDWIERLFKWILGSPAPARNSHGSIAGWGWALVALAALALVLLLWLVWRRVRRAPPPAIAAAAPLARASVETALASDRAHDEWLQVCRELEAAGEYRLALRAAFLAGLAALGAQQLITIRRDRTNLEYGRELQRRLRARSTAAVAPAAPALGSEGLTARPGGDAASGAANAGAPNPASLFADVIAWFDPVWYGHRPVDRDLLGRFVEQERRLISAFAASSAGAEGKA